MNYKEMLEKARKETPEITINTHKKFEVPAPEISRIGKKTMVLNLNKIAEYIGRETEDMLKFLSRELATSAVMEGYKAVFTGGFSRRILEDKLNRYIDTFVKCSECGRYETSLKKEDRITYIECMACGARKPVIA